MEKKGAMFAIAAIALCGLVVTADFFGLLGSKQVDMSDLLHLRVKPVDSKTGQVITDVHITCMRRKSEEACSQKAQSGEGVLTLNFLVGKTVVLSRLFRFKRSEELWLKEDGIVVLVFIQPNYERLFLQVKTPDIIEWGDQVKVIPLELSEPVTSAGQS